MNHIDLCSGIGGFALAARWMGWETIGFAEIDPFASRVLAKHWPGVPNYGDIAAVPSGVRADIVTAGIPCQPYSCAGKQLGAEDDRAIWPIAFEVIKRIKPDWCVIENVPGFINLALDGVLSDLEAEGYETGTLIIPACAVNAPHRRDRVWIAAHTGRFDSDGRGIERGEPKAAWTRDWITRSGEHAHDAANPNGARLERRNSEELRERSDQGTPWPICFSNPNRKPLGWATEPRVQRGGGQPEPGLGGTVDGIPGRMDRPWDGDWELGTPRTAKRIKDRANRLKAIGNAIVPQVAYQIFLAISAGQWVTL